MEEIGNAPIADASPSFDEADDARGRLAANDAEAVIVGDVRPPDEERVDSRQPPQVAHADASDTLHVIDKPEPVYHDQQYGDVRCPDEGSLPVEPSHTEVVGRASEEEGRTEVVRVGEGEDRGGANEPRRGWWQRLLS